MNRDLAVPLLLLLLLLLVWPLTPQAFLAYALVLAAFFALLVVPWLERTGPLRVLAILVAAGPFLAYGLLASPRPPDAFPMPGPGVWIVGAASVVVAGLPRRTGRVVAVVLLAWIAGDLLLGRAGLPLLPSGFNPVRDPLTLVGPSAAETFSAPDRRPSVSGLVVGQAANAAGGALARATEGTWPAGTRLVAIAGPVTPADWEGREVDGATLVAWPYGADADAVLLDKFAGIVVITEAHEEAWWARASEPVASYVRRGGVLVGPTHGGDWPEPLGRLLGVGRSYGLGLVRRAGSEDEIRASLVWGFEQPRVRTVFDGATRGPLRPEALEPWRDDPASRRPQALLLLFYAVVAAALDRILRGRAPRLIGLVAPSLALVLALSWTEVRDPGVRAHALALDLGGGGGRRVEALVLAAGPEGWAGSIRWTAPGYTYLLGGKVDGAGRVLVAPRATAWALRESVSTGQIGPVQPDPGAGFLRRLLRGPVGHDRTELGRGGILPAAIDGVDLPAAWVLRLR